MIAKIIPTHVALDESLPHVIITATVLFDSRFCDCAGIPLPAPGPNGKRPDYDPRFQTVQVAVTPGGLNTADARREIEKRLRLDWPKARNVDIGRITIEPDNHPAWNDSNGGPETWAADIA